MKGKSAVAETDTRYEIRDFKVVKVLKISMYIFPLKDTYNILLYHLKMTRNALHSVSRMKK